MGESRQGWSGTGFRHGGFLLSGLGGVHPLVKAFPVVEGNRRLSLSEYLTGLSKSLFIGNRLELEGK